MESELEDGDVEEEEVVANDNKEDPPSELKGRKTKAPAETGQYKCF